MIKGLSASILSLVLLAGSATAALADGTTCDSNGNCTTHTTLSNVLGTGPSRDAAHDNAYSLAVNNAQLACATFSGTVQNIQEDSTTYLHAAYSWEAHITIESDCVYQKS